MILRTKLKAAARVGIAVAILSSSLAAILLAQATGSVPNPASVPATQEAATPNMTGGQSQMESWWADLAETDPKSSRALLPFAAQPDTTVAFLQTKMLPLTITPD